MRIRKIKNKNTENSIRKLKNKNVNSSIIVEKIERKKIAGWPLMLGYISVFLIVSGVICLIPLTTLIFYPNESFRALCFVIPGVSSILLGIPGTFLLKGRKTMSLGKHMDYVLLIIIWAIAFVVNSLPFIFPTSMGGLNFTFSEAILEAVSGLTTTGLTALPRHAAEGFSPSALLFGTGHIFLFHRAFMCFVGGIGLVLVLSCVITNTFGMKTYYSEGHNDRFLPNLAKSARYVFAMYSAIILVGALLLYLCGMNEWSYDQAALAAKGEALPSFFDALCVSMTAVSAAGFTVRDASIAFYNSFPIEIISCLLMIIGSSNFLTVSYLLKRKYKKGFKDVEFKLTIVMALIFIPVIWLSMLFSPSLPVDISTGSGVLEMTPLHGLRMATFYYFSSVSTTGFDAMTNIGTNLSSLTIFLFIIVMNIGGSTGSAAGGIKKYRFVVALKGMYWAVKDGLLGNNYKHLYYPKTISRFGENKSVNNAEYRSCITYILFYLAIIMIFSLIISFLTPSNFGYLASLFEASTAISSAGLSIGITLVANDIVLWLLAILMFIGRLEIYAFIFGFYKIGKTITKRKDPINE